MAQKKVKPKTVNVSLIPRESPKGGVDAMYAMMDQLIAAHHDHLAEAHIALAWNLNWSADPDGRLILGKCKKIADLDRQLHGYDFVILLNNEAWTHPDFSTEMKLALMDHELCHAQVKRDDIDDPVMDERGKIVYRIKKHSLEEFREIVHRYGLWKDDIRAFVATAIRASHEPLMNALADKEGVIPESITGTNG